MPGGPAAKPDATFPRLSVLRCDAGLQLDVPRPVRSVFFNLHLSNAADIEPSRLRWGRSAPSGEPANSESEVERPWPSHSHWYRCPKYHDSVSSETQGYDNMKNVRDQGLLQMVETRPVPST